MAAALGSETHDCAARPGAWRCEPVARLYWDVASPAPGAFTVSSVPAPPRDAAAGLALAVPPFAAVPATLVDASLPSERLVFVLRVNRTVALATGHAQLNRAAECTYDGAEVRATLYTRRAVAAAPPVARAARAVPWPGRVDVVEVVAAAAPPPRCSDAMGYRLPDVQPAPGACECLYSSAA